MRLVANYSDLPSPCFVIEEDKLLHNLKICQRIKKETGIKIILAQKAFSNWFTYPLLWQYLDGAAASSIHEARLAAEEMKKEVHSYSPAYTSDQIKEYIKFSSHIVFNSISQYRRFAGLVHKYSNSCYFGLRVNPGYAEIEVDKYNPVLEGSRFGVHVNELDALPEGVSGLHYHAMCENNSYTFERILLKFESLYSHLFDQLKFINLGGGQLFSDQAFNINHFVSVIQSFQKRYPHIEIIIEPGAAIVLDSGYLLTTIVDILERKDGSIAIIDASFTAHMPDVLEMPYMPIIRNGVHGKDKPFIYKIGGNTCLSGDFIKEYSFDNPLKIGDFLIFEDQIQYSMVKTSLFNGVQHPAIAIRKLSGQYQLIREFDYLDFKGRLG